MAVKSKVSKYKNRFLTLVRHPFFWILTVSGNTIILIGSFALYYFESETQSVHIDHLDTLLWSTGIVTTVGYGSYEAETLPGKITIFLLMLAGTLFVWSYMAFLVTGLMAPELAAVEKNVHEVEKELLELKQKEKHEII